MRVSDAAKYLARWRVPLGYLLGIVAFLLAAPTPASLALGAAVGSLGEALRIWAAGHLEKGREVTRTGPYALTRHPLYVGSGIMGVGFAIAARSVEVAVLVGAYLAVTITAAIRSEEAHLTDVIDPLGGSFYVMAAACLATAILEALLPSSGPLISAAVCSPALFWLAWKYARPMNPAR